jgi:PleD family two-component response regulator
MSDADHIPTVPASAPPRILIVEPKRDYLGVLARRISENGFRVVTADGPQTAMAELHRSSVSLVLAELLMPHNGGLELVRMIRDDSALRDIPLLMITAKSDADAAVRAFAAGADSTIRKPFHFEVLVAKLVREIERARAVTRLRQDNATLDARVVQRSIALGEMRERFLQSESARKRLEQMVASPDPSLRGA